MGNTIEIVTTCTRNYQKYPWKGIAIWTYINHNLCHNVRNIFTWVVSYYFMIWYRIFATDMLYEMMFLISIYTFPCEDVSWFTSLIICLLARLAGHLTVLIDVYIASISASTFLLTNVSIAELVVYKLPILFCFCVEPADGSPSRN